MQSLNTMVHPGDRAEGPEPWEHVDSAAGLQEAQVLSSLVGPDWTTVPRVGLFKPERTLSMFLGFASSRRDWRWDVSCGHAHISPLSSVNAQVTCSRRRRPPIRLRTLWNCRACNVKCTDSPASTVKGR
jgi:hypothetical protein